MIEFTPTIPDDIPQIQEWTGYDPYHFVQASPEWWLTGAPDSVLAFCLSDECGPLIYVRIDAEGEYARIHIQFAPEKVVSKRRLVMGLLQGFETIRDMLKEAKEKGMVFNTINPSLAGFFQKQGFKSIGHDDYRLDFEG